MFNNLYIVAKQETNMLSTEVSKATWYGKFVFCALYSSFQKKKKCVGLAQL